jgi:ferredoxin
MTYVVTEACIKCKFTDCVPACVADCFYEGENMLVIHPEECIDCGACVNECRANAILPDTDPRAQIWLELNQKYASIWPNIVEKLPSSKKAEDWIEVADKYETHFSEKPAQR